jgi:putative transposase
MAIGVQIKELPDPPRLGLSPYDTDLMLCLLRFIAVLFIRVFRSRRDLLLENLALRQQLFGLKQRHPRPQVSTSDKLFWVILRRLWPEWKRALNPRPARDSRSLAPCSVQAALDEALAASGSCGQKMRQQGLARADLSHGSGNSTWGALRIHGELKMLGFDVSERTMLRWMRRAPRSPEPAKRWAAFLSNHREAFAAMDFFTVPTLTFIVLCCFFVIAHAIRRVHGSSSSCARRFPMIRPHAT